MSITMCGTKLVVQDVAAAARFYLGLGLKVVGRNVGGEEDVRQEQCWLSDSGEMSANMLILSRFLELPPPRRPDYPGEVWLAFMVTDVDATLTTVTKSGGKILRAAQDRPEHSVRAAVVTDPEGHIIEVLGPMST